MNYEEFNATADAMIGYMKDMYDLSQMTNEQKALLLTEKMQAGIVHCVDPLLNTLTVMGIKWHYVVHTNQKLSIGFDSINVRDRRIQPYFIRIGEFLDLINETVDLIHVLGYGVTWDVND